MIQQIFRTFVAILGLAVVLLSAEASAHELLVDQLTVWPNVAAGTLRGELLFDPELTRSEQSNPSQEHEQGVIRFARNQLQLWVDDQLLSPAYEVRELWRKGGATAGDLVVFSVALPSPSRTNTATLKVGAGAAWKSLVVSVQEPVADSRAQAHSWLLLAGDKTPVYLLGAEGSGSTWKKGGPEVFAKLTRLPVQGAALPKQSTWYFLQLGFFHILPRGLDHMLFVVALTLGAAAGIRRLILELSCFTVAHSCSLLLGSLGWVQASAAWVEPLIALSIAAMGIDNLRALKHSTKPSRSVFRLVVIFLFGLVHGLGFSYSLEQLSFAGSRWLWSLLSFNVGIEVGQGLVALAVAVALWFLRSADRRQRYMVVPGSIVVIAMGSFWAVERCGLWA